MISTLFDDTESQAVINAWINKMPLYPRGRKVTEFIKEIPL